MSVQFLLQNAFIATKCLVLPFSTIVVTVVHHAQLMDEGGEGRKGEQQTEGWD